MVSLNKIIDGVNYSIIENDGKIDLEAEIGNQKVVMKDTKHYQEITIFFLKTIEKFVQIVTFGFIKLDFVVTEEIDGRFFYLDRRDFERKLSGIISNVKLQHENCHKRGLEALGQIADALNKREQTAKKIAVKWIQLTRRAKQARKDKQNLEAFKKENPQHIEAFKNWVEAYKTDYVAHAVFGDNFEKVVEAKALCPSEQVLREKGVVEYEEGASGARGVVKLPQLEDGDVRLLDSLWEELEKAKERNPFFLNWQSVWKSGHPQAYKLIMDRRTEFQLGDDLRSYETGIGADEALVGLRKKYDSKGYDGYLLRVAYDQKRKERNMPSIDDYIADQNNHQILAEGMESHGRRTNPLLEMRRLALGNGKLQSQIFVSKQKIFWGYGDVAVVIGNVGDILEGHYGNQARFPSPVSNGGKFFNVSLDRDDTFVIGPLKSYLKLKEKIRNSGARFIPYEAMSSDQLKFFEVPERLRPVSSKTLNAIASS